MFSTLKSKSESKYIFCNTEGLQCRQGDDILTLDVALQGNIYFIKHLDSEWTAWTLTIFNIQVILANTATTGLLPVLAWIIFISTSIKK